MTATYCPTCYRDLPDDATCPSCAARHAQTRPAARLPLRIGALGLPLLVFGLLAPSHSACVAGAVLAGTGVLAHIVLTLRGD